MYERAWNHQQFSSWIGQRETLEFATRLVCYQGLCLRNPRECFGCLAKSAFQSFSSQTTRSTISKILWIRCPSTSIFRWLSSPTNLGDWFLFVRPLWYRKNTHFLQQHIFLPHSIIWSSDACKDLKWKVSMYIQTRNSTLLYLLCSILD